MMNLAPQLAFAGECRQAFEFYAKLLCGAITVVNTFGGNEDRELPPGSVAAAADQIRFAEISFGDNSLRPNNVPAGSFAPMRGFTISLHLDNVDDARRIFAGLAEGGEVTTPLGKVKLGRSVRDGGRLLRHTVADPCIEQRKWARVSPDT